MEDWEDIYKFDDITGKKNSKLSLLNRTHLSPQDLDNLFLQEETILIGL